MDDRGIDDIRRRAAQSMVKRLFDIAVSGLALIVLSPVLAIVAIGVRYKLGRPVLFRQLRPGLHCEPFELIKFRTMLDAEDAHGESAAGCVAHDAVRVVPALDQPR